MHTYHGRQVHTDAKEASLKHCSFKSLDQQEEYLKNKKNITLIFMQCNSEQET